MLSSIALRQRRFGSSFHYPNTIFTATSISRNYNTSSSRNRKLLEGVHSYQTQTIINKQQRHQQHLFRRNFADNATTTGITSSPKTSHGGNTISNIRPMVSRGIKVSVQERAALREARKERATRLMLSESQGGGGAGVVASSSSSSNEGNLASSSLSSSTATTAAGTMSSTSGSTNKGFKIPLISGSSRMFWIVSFGIPTAILTWGIVDNTSPPAKFSKFIGLTDFIQSYTEILAKPVHDKLLPDWSQMPNIPLDIPVPHTLVLDLEKTLVSSTWDRKYGWRHAKRPGVDKFLHDMAQYYEIVLYSPSLDGVADPVVASLDKDGCIMHRLYRDATYYINGVHVKDLNRLNRNVKRMIVLDDDPLEVQLNPENLIRVKPYIDPTDHNDTTLERITPFLIEIAREGYNDIPALLKQYEGMDADEIADEQERRVMSIRTARQRRAKQGLGRLAPSGGGLPPPELPPDTMMSYNNSRNSSSTQQRTQQLTAKDIAGAVPTSKIGDNSNVTNTFQGWLERRAKEKEELQMRKLEKWNEVMMKKQREKREQEQQQAQA